MPRIKSIKEPLQPFSTFPVIKKKRNNTETRCAIVSHSPCDRQKSNAHAGSENISFVLKKIEQENSNNSKDCIPVFTLISPPDQIKDFQSNYCQKECQHYILMTQVDLTFKSQIKWHFAYQCKYPKPKNILFPVSCMNVSFCNTK